MPLSSHWLASLFLDSVIHDSEKVNTNFHFFLFFCFFKQSWIQVKAPCPEAVSRQFRAFRPVFSVHCLAAKYETSDTQMFTQSEGDFASSAYTCNH